jgi:hypothetical protein
MTEVCSNGHVRTEENTRWYRFGRGDKLKRRCDDCRKAKSNYGGAPAHEQQARRTTELHEDIEDLLKFGATFEEIVQRSGFSNWDRMRRSLKSRDRDDLIRQMQTKRGDVVQSEITASTISGAKSKLREQQLTHEWIPTFN